MIFQSGKIDFCSEMERKDFFYFSTHLASNIIAKFELPNCFRSWRTSDESVLVIQ